MENLKDVYHLQQAFISVVDKAKGYKFTYQDCAELLDSAEEVCLMSNFSWDF